MSHQDTLEIIEYYRYRIRKVLDTKTIHSMTGHLGCYARNMAEAETFDSLVGRFCGLTAEDWQTLE